MAIPEGAAFGERVAWIRSEAEIGNRSPREVHLAGIAKRDEAWISETEESAAVNQGLRTKGNQQSPNE